MEMKTRKGFTLMELMVVIAVLGVLIAMVVPAVSGYVDAAKRKVVQTTISQFQTAVVAYELTEGKALNTSDDAELKKLYNYFGGNSNIEIITGSATPAAPVPPQVKGGTEEPKPSPSEVKPKWGIYHKAGTTGVNNGLGYYLLTLPTGYASADFATGAAIEEDKVTISSMYN
ncbi:MAG: type II secretion system protein [Lachnospirales bacterium]